MWGHSITWQAGPNEKGHDDNHGVIVGWLTERPRSGDILAVKMQTGKWGKWLIEDVEYMRDPTDMFFAHVSGAYGYLPDEQVPASAYSSSGDFV